MDQPMDSGVGSTYSIGTEVAGSEQRPEGSWHRGIESRPAAVVIMLLTSAK